jgi:hypothetical protein
MSPKSWRGIELAFSHERSLGAQRPEHPAIGLLSAASQQGGNTLLALCSLNGVTAQCLSADSRLRRAREILAQRSVTSCLIAGSIASACSPLRTYSAQRTQLKALLGWIYRELQGKLWNSFLSFFLYHHAQVAIQNMPQVAGEIFSDSCISASKHYLPDRIEAAPASVRASDTSPRGSREGKHAVVLSLVKHDLAQLRESLWWCWLSPFPNGSVEDTSGTAPRCGCCRFREKRIA